MSKQKHLYTDLMNGLEDGIAWAQGKKRLSVTERKAESLSPSETPIATEDLYRPLNLFYDQENDTLSISFNEAEVEESYETEPGVLRDYDRSGNLIKLEIQNFAQRVGQPALIGEAVRKRSNGLTAKKKATAGHRAPLGSQVARP
jgi:uncharacterized protein YuzE